MEIPYTVTARPDTGLWNAKIGIWLFLASEVMLFGGLFSAYIFLRLDAEPGYWPHGLLNVPVGTLNTAILIASSVTVVLAWASLKMRQLRALSGLHGDHHSLRRHLSRGQTRLTSGRRSSSTSARILRSDALEKYEQYLGNHHLDGGRTAAARRDHRPPAQSRGAQRSEHQGIRESRSIR